MLHEMASVIIHNGNGRYLLMIGDRPSDPRNFSHRVPLEKENPSFWLNWVNRVGIVKQSMQLVTDAHCYE